MKKVYPILIISFLFIGCFNNSQPNDPIPVHESFKIDSKKVGETRTINVWMPPGYSKTTDSLAVIYMPDGGIKEDFPHVANTIAELIKSKSIPPVILVGIENTERRRDLTGKTVVAEDKKIAPVVGGSEKFRAFVKEELFPEINKRYSVTDSRSIIGESAAGLFIVETFFADPDMFDNYIAIDPSLWWNNHYLVTNAKQLLSKFPESEKKLWFASSDTEDIAPYTKTLAEILTSENRKNLKWNYANEPKETHATIYRATKVKALLWTFNKKEKN